MLEITKLYIRDTDSKKDLFELVDGMEIDPAKLSKNWNIRAEVVIKPDAITFALDGNAPNTEVNAPFCLGGDTVAVNAPYGKHTLKANDKSVTFTIKQKVTPPPPPDPKPTPDPTPTPSSGVAVGPTRAIKDLTAMKDNMEYVLDPGTYDIKAITVKGKLIIRSADPKNPATIKFPSVWGKLPSPPDVGPPAQGATIVVYGHAELNDVKTIGGEDVIVFQTQVGSTLSVQNVTMDGGGILRGSGAKDVYMKNVQSSGKPRAYFIANFTNRCEKMVLDLTNTMPIQQGGWKNANGTSQGEAAMRFMDCGYVKIIGAKTKPWLHDGTHVWKQEVQFRPDTDLIEAENCHFVLVDIGDMTWRKPPHIIKQVTFTNCILDQHPHLTPGSQIVKYVNTTVAGTVVNK